MVYTVVTVVLGSQLRNDIAKGSDRWLNLTVGWLLRKGSVYCDLVECAGYFCVGYRDKEWYWPREALNKLLKTQCIWQLSDQYMDGCDEMLLCENRKQSKHWKSMLRLQSKATSRSFGSHNEATV